MEAFKSPRAMAVKSRCRKFLSYDYPETAAETLRKLADYAGPEMPQDESGSGRLHELLEEKLTALFGHEAAVFMPSGKTAQEIAFRLWCERAACFNLGLHPRSHVEEHEERAYAHLYGMKPVALSPYDRQTEPRDIDALAQPLGVATIELPLRPLGCVLPSWEDLKAISAKLEARGIAFHADAARIWESGPCYARPYDEIAGLFDSLYVSFYKGLGGIAGGALVGPRDLVAETRVWQRRLGARPPKLFPYLIDALRGIERRLPLMQTFHDHARALAKAIAEVPAVRVTPDPPHANAFMVLLDGDHGKLKEAALEVSERTGLWVMEIFFDCPYQGLALFEVTVREASLDVTPQEAAEAVARLKSLLS